MNMQYTEEIASAMHRSFAFSMHTSTRFTSVGVCCASEKCNGVEKKRMKWCGGVVVMPIPLHLGLAKCISFIEEKKEVRGCTPGSLR